ncbi:NAD(P)-binding domain-containing protein [Sediminibacillus albus]|uniref:Pyridine nucleotide-disulphide oxidoreductase n=1 Tax=Sediminibacillus albus TaxID=407036 RepID=A0A1G8YLG5_9BACI|nr:NAD(P)-binding domain-containing protein [Sediminibacillus albus]SDK02910.1 Pyridine nucleotide-disulphide oxidoreductase [Sediminibacillus albus]
MYHIFKYYEQTFKALSDEKRLHILYLLAELPIVVIGSGPVGLAAAAHLNKYNQPFLILEKGSKIVSNILEWRNVQLFSHGNSIWMRLPNSYYKRLIGLNLKLINWPTGKELVEEYLEPLANHPQIKERILYQAEILNITKKNWIK